MIQVKDDGRNGDKHSYSPSILKTEPTGFPDEFNVGYAERGGFSGSSAGKESACNVGDPGSIPRLGRSPVFLPGESPWTDKPGGLQSWGHQESDTTEHLQKEKSQGPSEGFKPEQLEGWSCH